MKLPSFLLFLAACSSALAAEIDKSTLDKKYSAGMPAGVQELKIGDTAPDFALPGIDGKTHPLSEYKDAKVLMIAFLSNHCPDSHAVETRLLPFVASMRGKSFQIVAINPNNPDGISIDELGYSKYNDSFAEMKPYAKEAGFTFPYLYDGDTQATARAYGCLATPHIFIFDAERKLRYKGEFDNSHFADPATVTASPGKDAAEALVAGRPVTIAETKPHGCSTKWITKKDSVVARVARWNKDPVQVETIDAAGIAALRANKTSKLRLINVWATWCVPCVQEFPGLVQNAHWFSLRPTEFEMITISADAPADSAKAQAFLQKQGAGLSKTMAATLVAENRTTNSYLFSGSDLNALGQALDPQWPGPLPHTVLVAPGGEIIWRQNGVVDPGELKARIVQALGPYFTR
jgi:peroxiredoxin